MLDARDITVGQGAFNVAGRDIITYAYGPGNRTDDKRELSVD
jgi:hypothetical protein